MKLSLEEYIENFLRNYKKTFTAKQLSELLNEAGFKLKVKEVEQFLKSDIRVFALEKKLYITRAGAFSDQIFSFLPTAQEINQRGFVPGDRFIPFVDGEMFSYNLKFEFLGKILEKKTLKTDSNTARELFSLFGDEFSTQYISTDPACKKYNIVENDFELPYEMELTAVSLEPVFKVLELRYGDRLLCRVKDWNKGLIEIFPSPFRKENPFQVTEYDLKRQVWNEELEKSLLESFKVMGPCSGMEEQLANVFYENRKKLCVPWCGSIHEFMDQTKKINMELYGVETRLWRSGEVVPAVGEWNGNSYGYFEGDGTIPFFKMQFFIVECFLIDHIYEKKDDINELIKKLKSIEPGIDFFGEERLTLQLEEDIAILKESYNLFADYPLGRLRHEALELYTKVKKLVISLESVAKELQEIPQMELVSLAQLYTHVLHIIQKFTMGEPWTEDEKHAVSLSLDGMSYSFEEIKVPIAAAITKIKKNKFLVV